MPTLRNPKTGEEITTDLKPADAFAALEKMKSNSFAQDLHLKFAEHPERIPSEAQWFWIFKLAIEDKPTMVIELKSDLHEWLLSSGLSRLMWKIDNEQRIKLYISKEKIDVVFSGGDFARRVGNIVGTTFSPTKRCPTSAAAQIQLLAQHKMVFLTAYGKKWGRCCVCGRELENEESVAAGIGPVCAGRME